MDTCCAKPEDPDEAFQSPKPTSSPQDVLIHIPRTRKDKPDIPPQPSHRSMDAKLLDDALSYVADYIAKRGRHIKMVAAGGIVSTLYLQTRDTTYDVDLFGSNCGNADRRLLDDALHDALERFSPLLGTRWLNTKTHLWMSTSVHQTLTKMAEQQEEMVFNRPGLTLFAAPWDYAFTAKICRISAGKKVKPYDLPDAINYIHRYIQSHGNKAVPMAVILDWANYLEDKINPQVLLTSVNLEYRRQYQRDAVVI